MTNSKKTGRPRKSMCTYELTAFELQKIVGIHPDLPSIAIQPGNLEYLLDSIKLIRKDFFDQLLHCHPLTVVEKSGKIYCIANLRLFQAAKILLDETHKIPCLQVMNLSPESIVDFAQADFYLTHLLYSLRPADSNSQFLTLWDQLDAALRKRITPEITNITLQAKFLKMSRQRHYPLKKKNDNNGSDNDS
jgi:hypothetical protein